MVMYTVALRGGEIADRRVALVFSTDDGETRNESRTDRTGVVSMWGPWSPAVRILLDGEPVTERAHWEERPADRYAEVTAT